LGKLAFLDDLANGTIDRVQQRGDLFDDDVLGHAGGPHHDVDTTPLIDLQAEVDFGRRKAGVRGRNPILPGKQARNFERAVAAARGSPLGAAFDVFDGDCGARNRQLLRVDDETGDGRGGGLRGSVGRCPRQHGSQDGCNLPSEGFDHLQFPDADCGEARTVY
jgi:hypothetical protein